jgi:N-acyl-D-amino-acid deacylase
MAGGLAATQFDGTARAQPPSRPVPDEVPVNGKAAPGLEAFDAAMVAIMDRHGIPGAGLAITKGGKLVLARGYGWANLDANSAAGPGTQFALASLSKAFTAVAALLLVEQGKLSLDDRVFEILSEARPPRGARVDPRLATVTVRQCLNHSGGWDRDVSGDPTNWEPQICRALKLKPPLGAQHFIEFVLGLPLDFAPGTQQKYSNVGFIILGEVIGKLSGRPYERFVSESVLGPMGMKRTGLFAFDGKYGPAEAVRYLAGSMIALPAMVFPMIKATGGWSSTAVDMARFLTNLDGSRGTPVLAEKTRKLMMEPPQSPLKVRDNGTWFGLGWDSVIVNDKGFGYFKDGSYQGMRTFMKRQQNGVSWVLLYNAGMEFDPQDTQLATKTVQEVRRLVEGFDKYPDVDLFKEYE